MKHSTELINALKNALIETKARLYQLEDGMRIEQSKIHARAFVGGGIRQLRKESHNATPTQHETATNAENHNETDD